MGQWHCVCQWRKKEPVRNVQRHRLPHKRRKMKVAEIVMMKMRMVQLLWKLTAGSSAAPMDTDMIDEEDEDAAMQLALQMSMQPDMDEEESAQKPSSAAASSSNEEGQQQFQDPQFVNQLLGSLPGVDTNDPALNSALRNMLDKKD